MHLRNYDERAQRYGVDVIRYIKNTIDKLTRREHNEYIREALRCKSGSEFLREMK